MIYMQTHQEFLQMIYMQTHQEFLHNSIRHTWGAAYLAATAFGNQFLAQDEDLEDLDALDASKDRSAVWYALQDSGACNPGLLATQAVQTEYELGVCLRRWGRRDWYAWLHECSVCGDECGECACGAPQPDIDLDAVEQGWQGH